MVLLIFSNLNNSMRVTCFTLAFTTLGFWLETNPTMKFPTPLWPIQSSESWGGWPQHWHKTEPSGENHHGVVTCQATSSESTMCGGTLTWSPSASSQATWCCSRKVSASRNRNAAPERPSGFPAVRLPSSAAGRGMGTGSRGNPCNSLLLKFGQCQKVIPADWWPSSFKKNKTKAPNLHKWIF